MSNPLNRAADMSAIVQVFAALKRKHAAALIFIGQTTLSTAPLEVRTSVETSLKAMWSEKNGVLTGLERNIQSVQRGTWPAAKWHSLAKDAESQIDYVLSDFKQWQWGKVAVGVVQETAHAAVKGVTAGVAWIAPLLVLGIVLYLALLFGGRRA